MSKNTTCACKCLSHYEFCYSTRMLCYVMLYRYVVLLCYGISCNVCWYDVGMMLVCCLCVVHVVYGGAIETVCICTRFSTNQKAVGLSPLEPAGVTSQALGEPLT